jgi:hypothetical protein
MNHGWPNLASRFTGASGTDGSCDVLGAMEAAGITLRVLSYDVRRSAMVPEKPGGRFAVYVGTGGPGHIDPYRNDGISEGSQGIREDVTWEPRIFELFDAIKSREDAVLLGVCHTFGVMCRWSGIAEAVLRGPKRGQEHWNSGECTDFEGTHPWFRHLSESHCWTPPANCRQSAFDLIPPVLFLTVWCRLVTRHLESAPRGNADHAEWSRDRGGVMPRIFGVNHHPEIWIDRDSS